MAITDEMRRHSAAHLTARAVMNLFDDVQVDIGPATEDGFYYDFDLEHRLSPEDFPKIEAEVSTGIGLKNLSSRWLMITEKDIEVIRTDTTFEVHLPLKSEAN